MATMGADGGVKPGIPELKEALSALQKQKAELARVIALAPDNLTLKSLRTQLEDSIAQVRETVATLGGDAPEVGGLGAKPTVQVKSKSQADEERQAEMRLAAEAEKRRQLSAAPKTASAAAGGVGGEGGEKKLGKFTPPAWASADAATALTLECKKDGKVALALDLAKRACHIFGRARDQCHVPLEHESISRQHCVIVNGRHPKAPDAKSTTWLIDLGSAQGTSAGKDFKSLAKLKPNQPFPLVPGAAIRIGKSSRVYVVRATGSGGGGSEGGGAGKGGGDGDEPATKRRRLEGVADGDDDDSDGGGEES